MDLVKCPFCNKEIEKYFFYCDQCGEELKVCPSGHGFKKGKICSECGTKLVEAKNHQAQQPQTMEAKPKYLVSAALNARLELKNGAIIGRKAGDYINVFGNQDYVSRTHARVQKNDAGVWEIVDLDSANGTFLNGQKLAPNQPGAFKIGDTITFYDIKFLVSE